jgi:hypothetical protein
MLREHTGAARSGRCTPDIVVYGPDGLWARNKTREQEMRVLQLLHMDNRMNILQAMQESSPEVRDVWVSAALVHPGPTSFARTLPVISGAKRRTTSRRHASG